MKTIFAKYNSERLPKYQIVTKIVLDKNSQKYAIKEALCDEAKEHIEDIYNNYKLLKSSYSINLVKPTKIENGLSFDMAKGISLENILLDAITQNDRDKFKKYINIFLNFVDDMVCERNVVFKPSQEFEEVFGEWKIDELQDIIKVANIDLIFGNIFVDENDEFTLIDYEWVFDFEIPKSYIVWRSFATFISFNSIDLCRFINYVDEEQNKLFSKIDNIFSDFVRGKEKKYFLTPRVTKVANFINLDKKEKIINYDYFIQLFIEDEKGISEENSIKYPVALNNEIQKFEFDLKDKDNIKSLRLDSLNDYCIIKINEIRLNNIIYKDFINTNAFFKEDNIYYFNTNDSLIYISLPSDISIDTFSIEVKYLKIGKDTITDISNVFSKIFNEKEQNIQSLNIELENRDISIQNLTNEVSEKEQNIQSLNIELGDRDKSIENLRNEVNKKEQNIQSLNIELGDRDKSIENLRNEVNEKERNIQEKLLDIEILREKTKLYYPDVHNKFFKGLK